MWLSVFLDRVFIERCQWSAEAQLSHCHCLEHKWAQPLHTPGPHQGETPAEIAPASVSEGVGTSRGLYPTVQVSCHDVIVISCGMHNYMYVNDIITKKVVVSSRYFVASNSYYAKLP